jgi:hypothetical protein
LLTTVKILTLAENRITGSLPSQVADMINLQTLSSLILKLFICRARSGLSCRVSGLRFLHTAGHFSMI